jgi:plasmid stabilization system protein ParE
MAKKIIWTEQAKTERREILEFWVHHNGNKTYSRKLSTLFRKTIRYVAKYYYAGRATDYENVRVAPCGNFLLFYMVNHDSVIVLSIFDGRRNPDDLKIDNA